MLPRLRPVAPEHLMAMGFCFELSQPGSKTTSEPMTRDMPSVRLLRCTKTSWDESAEVTGGISGNSQREASYISRRLPSKFVKRAQAIVQDV